MKKKFITCLFIVGIIILVSVYTKYNHQNTNNTFSDKIKTASQDIKKDKSKDSPEEKKMIKLNIDPKKLYEGCIQASITHAITAGVYPDLVYENTWDGVNNNLNNSEGCRATITFNEKYIIAVFQDVHSKNYYKDAMIFFEGAPDDLIKLAKETTLQYVLDKIDGVTKPVVTAAFWGTWEQLNSTQSYDEIMENSDYIIQNHLLSFDDALEEEIENYELDDKQTALIRDLFNRKMAAKGKDIELTEEEIQGLYGDKDLCFTSLKELGIIKKK